MRRRGHAERTEVVAFLQSMTKGELVAYCTGLLMANGADVPQIDLRTTPMPSADLGREFLLATAEVHSA